MALAALSPGRTPPPPKAPPPPSPSSQAAAFDPLRLDATLLKSSKLCSLVVCLVGLGLANLPMTLASLSRLQAQLSLQAKPLQT